MQRPLTNAGFYDGDSRNAESHNHREPSRLKVVGNDRPIVERFKRATAPVPDEY